MPQLTGKWAAAPVRQSEYIIQNQEASSYEYNFALACDYWGIEYEFQQDFFGGRNILGGMVIDFIVFTVPLPTPCWINGEYAHGSGERKEQDYLQQSMMNTQFGGAMLPAKVFWGDDTSTYEAAVQAVRRELL